MTTVLSDEQLLANLHKLNKKRVQNELGASAGTIYPLIIQGRDFIVETGTTDDISLLLPPLLRVRKVSLGVQALIIRERPEDVERSGALLLRILAQRGTKKRPFSVAALGIVDSARRETEVVSKKPDVVITTAARLIDHLRRDNLQIDSVRTCVIEDPGEAHAESFNADIEFIRSKLRGNPQISVFLPQNHSHAAQLASVLRRPVTVPLSTWSRSRISRGSESRSHSSQQESTAMSKNSFQHVRKDQALKARIKDVLREIHEDEDPEELNAYRSIINANVSIFSRGYFAAYLLKQLATGGAGSSGGGRGRRSRSGAAAVAPGGRPAKQQQQPQQPRSANAPATSASAEPDPDSSSIFVSVGKNRKVYPKDLIQLFSAVDGVDAEDIGQIKILDNYSFVEVTNEKSDAAIEGLNNTEFRGRKITVNYARKKD